jgi:hypothetical protein
MADPASRKPLLLLAGGESRLWTGRARDVVAGAALPQGGCPTP